MSYPPGITLRPVTIGGATTLESGEQLSLVAEVKSSRSLMWGATGWQFHAVPRTIKGNDGEELSFSLPVTDLTGWRLLDNPGSAIDVSTPGSYTHMYTIKLTTLQGGRPVAVRTVGPFVLPAEDLSPVDLDLMLPVGTQAGGVVQVPDTWDAKVAAAEAVTAAITPAGLVLTSATDAEAQRAALAVVERSAALAPSLPRQRHPRPTVWTAFQSGHGWTTGGAGATWNLSDSTDPLATHAASFVSSGSSTMFWIQELNGVARDLSNHDITIWVKVTAGLDNLKSLAVYAASDNLVNYRFGTIYDGTWPAAPLRAWREGEWYPLRFSVTALAGVTGSPNLAAITGIRIGFADFGTGAVSMQIGRVEYTARPSGATSGLVSLTFDDSLLDTYTVAAPILARHGMRATSYTIRDRLGEPGFMSLSQLHDLETKYGWEIAAHADTIANHDAGFTTLSSAVLDAELAALKAFLLKEGFGGADHLAYPRGWHSAAVDAVAARYFATGRTIYDNPVETCRPVPLRLRSVPVGPATAAATMTAKIDAALAAKGWLIITLHGVVTGTPVANQVSSAWLSTVTDHLASVGAEVIPVGEAWRSLL